jgi:membrane protein implicated in regulation of membrane protease activity
MAAIVIKGNAKPTGFAGMAGLRAKACGMVQRAMACTAAAVLVCAAGAALLQLVVQMLNFPAPIAVTGITVMAVTLLNSLRRYLRTRATGKAGNPHRVQR